MDENYVYSEEQLEEWFEEMISKYKKRTDTANLTLAIILTKKIMLNSDSPDNIKKFARKKRWYLDENINRTKE